MTNDKMVKGHDLFRALNVEETNQISGFSSTKKYAANETIFKLGGFGHHVYMLLEGAVYLRLPSKPEEFSLVVSRIEKGELFGLSPLLGSPRYTASAECSEASEVLCIEAKPFRELLQNNCPVGFHIMSQVAQIYFTRYIDVLKNLQGVVSQIPLIR